MPVVLFVLLWWVLAPVLQAHADDTRLIRAGTVWRYYKGFTEPAQPVGNWRLPEFDDSAWAESMSGFSTSAYAPEPGYLTDYGLGYTTVYLRKKFTVFDPKSLAELTLRVDYDDGFIVYLNGEEITRRGIAGPVNQPLPRDRFATNHVRGPTEEVDVTAAIPLLRNGDNVIAVQCFGSSATDYTFAFVPELLGNFTRGPFIQNTTSNSTQIIFKTLSRAPAMVQFGTNGAATNLVFLSDLDTNHVATLSGLQPDQEYQYRVGAVFNGWEMYTDWHRFRTFKPAGKISFAVLGDSGWGNAAQHSLAAQMRAASHDLIMHVGDVIYYAFTHGSADFRCLSVYADQMYNTPMFLALGNHDVYLDAAAALQTFYLPTNNVTGTEHFYSFDHGDVHFAVAWSDPVFTDYKPGTPQYNWLDEDLRNSKKPWKFLFFHHGWRTSGPHTYDDYDQNKVLDSVQLDQSFVSLARKHGVQIVFNGHDHEYERFTPAEGVLSFVSGGGGAIPYSMALLHPDSVQYYSRYEFLSVNVEGDEALVQAVGTDGVAFDRVHVKRSDPERKTYSTARHTPQVELATPGDGDGNVVGERFDFEGEPIAGRMGQQSSSGRLFINVDKDNLYLGLDEVMLHTGDELFLFLEVPGLPGVSSMSELSLQAPATNSLSSLSSLAFTNFAPGIGIILGDEFGDGAFTTFTRAGALTNTGQGAFYLTNGLPLVAGQRLAQFNRSPQDGPVIYEQNANYIKVALPYSALGLAPGDKIKVGAIVGLAYSTNASPAGARLLDAGIGYSIFQNDGLKFVEGVEVQLGQVNDIDDDGLTNEQELSAGTDPTNPDTDGDGLPDGWEVINGTNPLVADAALDPDKDQMSNLEEFLAGTDPMDPKSKLVAVATRRGIGRVEIVWSAVPGRLYRLKYRDSFNEPFRDLLVPAFPMRAQNAIESYTIDLPVEDRARYYQVEMIAE